MLRGTLIYELLQLTEYWAKTLSLNKVDHLNVEKIKFGTHSSQYLMLYSPMQVDPSKPLLIYYHGGGWIFGKPELFTKKAKLFTDLGYQVIMPCYRKVPLYHADHILEDVGLMMKHLRVMQSDGKIGQLDRILLGGVSAGANLISLLYFQKKLHEPAGFTQRNFCGLFLYAPPMDLSQMSHTPVLYRYAGSRKSARFRDASPINFIAGSSSIPVLCVHGQKDGLVQYEASQTFRSAYERLHPGFLKYQSLPEATHLDAASWAIKDNDMRKQLLAWMKSVS